ncbi:hypothetical protein JKP88DRAFT_262492 [Tribonema minus]|uniref:Magnesium transporter protein 1 n=1 Tax=Tribonema minus TaxID=303371 RepID=A0A836CKN7_9STRA|nr:hypothetical protein JKP88DRAFT_262492 [Tribonema minus]
MNTPRPYHVVILFNAAAPHFKCSQCLVIKPKFAELARSYHLVHDVQNEDRPVFWVTIDVDSGKSAFMNVQLQSAPHIFMLPPDKAYPMGKALPEKLGAGTHVLLASGPDTFAALFTETTGESLVVLRDMTYLQLAVCLAAALVAVLAHFVVLEPTRMLALVRSKALWLMVSLATYTVGVGGLIYCIIRNPQEYGTKPTGINSTGHKVVLFSTNARDQWWWEGIVVAFLYLLMAGATWGITSAVQWRRAHPLLRNLAVCCCIAVLVHCIREFLALYILKSPWYNFSSQVQMLPAPLAALLSTGTIRKSSGIGFRVVRLSAIWLNQYPGLKAFGRKVKVLLVDYVVRTVKEAFRTRYMP